MVEYILNQDKFTVDDYVEKRNRIFQLMLLYDKLDFPIMNNSFVLNDDICEYAEVLTCKTSEIYMNYPILVDDLSCQQAKEWKPIVVNTLVNYDWAENYLDVFNNSYGSVNNAISYLYDAIYDDFTGMERLWEYCLKEDKPNSSLKEIDYDWYFERIVNMINMMTVKRVYLYYDYNKDSDKDYYSLIFNNFNTENNVTEAYGILKMNISNILELQPSFNNIKEVIDFKRKNKKAIKDLKEELCALEDVLINYGNEKATEKAIEDIRKANSALIKDTPYIKISRFVTLISVPVSLVGWIPFSTPLSFVLSLCGAATQIKNDVDKSKSNWIYTVR